MLVRKKLWPKVFYFTPDSVIRTIQNSHPSPLHPPKKKKTIGTQEIGVNSPKPIACVSDEHKRYSATHHVVTKPPDSKPGPTSFLPM